MDRDPLMPEGATLVDDNTTKRRDPLMPEGALEMESYEDKKSLDPLNPMNDYPRPNGVPKPMPKRNYIPDAISGPEYAEDVAYIKNRAFKSGDTGFEDLVSIDKGRVQWALENAKGLTPEVAAKVQQIADKTNIPFEHIQQNSQEWFEWQEATGVFRSLFETKKDGSYRYPRVATWLSDPNKMAMAKDDIQTLQRIENDVAINNRPWYSIVGTKLKEGTKDLVRGGLGAAQAMTDMLAQYEGPIDPTDPYFAATTAIREAKAAYGDDVYDKAFKALRENPAIAPRVLPEVDSKLEQFGYDFAQGAPQFGGTLISTLMAGPQAGAAFIGSYIFGDTYGGLKDQGVSTNRALVAATANAATQAALEYIPLKSLSGALKAKGTKEALVKFFETGVKEVGTEFIQSFPDDFTRLWGEAEVKGQDLNQTIAVFVDRLPETAKQGLYEGLLVLPFAGLLGSVRLSHDLVRAKRHELDLKAHDNIEKAAGESKLRERSPEMFENFLKDTFKASGGSDKMFIPVKPALQFFQDSDGKFKDFADALGITEQLKEAELTGKELEVSRAKFYSLYAGTEVAKALREHIRFDVDGKSATEIENDKKDLLDNITQMQAELKALDSANEMPPEIKAMRDKLILPKEQGGMGFKAEDADQSLALQLAFARTFSAKIGETLPEFFKRVNPILRVGDESFSSEGALDQGFRNDGGNVNSGWIDSEGEMHSASKAGHQDFIDTNEEMLVERGLVKPEEVENTSIDYMINEKGWVRVQDSGDDRAFFHFKSSKKTKDKIIDYLVRNPRIKTVELWDEKSGENGAFKAEDVLADGIDKTLKRGEKLFQSQQTTRTDTPEFKAWFGNSKVVDESGKPLVVYHGTNVDFSQFKRNLRDIGIHFGTIGQANDRMKFKSVMGEASVGQNIMPVYLSIKNPLRLSDVGAWNYENVKYAVESAGVMTAQETKAAKTIKGLREALLKKGFDGIVYKNTGEGEGLAEAFAVEADALRLARNEIGFTGSVTPEQQNHPAYKKYKEAYDARWALSEKGEDSYIAFDPTQIKSINNRGTWDRNNPNILMQSQPTLAPEFYSKLEKTIEDKVPNNATPEQIRATLKEIKAEEMQYSGINEFLEGKKKVSKAELLEAVKANQIQIEEVVRGHDNTELRKAAKAIDDFNASVRERLGKDSFSFEDMTDAEEQKYNELQAAYEAARDRVGGAQPKFSQWKLSGGENYREILFTLPEPFNPDQKKTPRQLAKELYGKDSFYDLTDEQQKEVMKRNTVTPDQEKSVYRSSHWEEPNVLAHTRLQDYTDADGKKVLLVEEVQSDWHQAGRDNGYNNFTEADFKRQNKLRNEITEARKKWEVDVNEKTKPLYDQLKEIEKLGPPEVLPRWRQNNSGLWAWFAEGKQVSGAYENKDEKENARSSISHPEDVRRWEKRFEILKEIDRIEGNFSSFGEVAKHLYENGRVSKELYDEYETLSKKEKAQETNVPDAPFKKTWHEFVLKKILRMAAEQGYDRIAWTTGDQQAERYDLSKQVGYITYDNVLNDDPNDEKEFEISVFDKSGNNILEKSGTASELSEVVGKDIVKKMIDGVGDEIELSSPRGGRVVHKKLAGENLKVGGEGMRGFYDKMIPDFLNKYAKKWGAKAGWTELPTGPRTERENDLALLSDLGLDSRGDRTQKVHSLDITPEMKNALLFEGQPLFQNNQGPRASIEFTDTATYINLYKNADMSSLLHESAHLFIKELKRAIDLNLADEQTRKDYDTLLAFMGGKFDVDGQEKVARAFEAYLREGKAPSISLRDAFRKFKAWLMAIYRAVANLDVEINDEVRGIFDRMLASEQEIQEAEEYYNQKKSLLDLLPIKPETKIMLLEKQSMAHELALEKQTKKLLKAFITASGGMRNIREAAKREVEAMPEYKAITQIKAEGGVDGNALLNVADKEAFEKHGLISKDPKTTIEKAAVDNNFESPEALIEAVKKSFIMKDAIESRAKAIVNEAEAEIKKDLTRQELINGEESIHNDASFEYLVAQAEELQKALAERQPKPTPQSRIQAQAIKDAAREIIGKKSIRQAPRYDLYAKAEQRYANEAYKLLKKGDIEGAYTAIKKQMLNHALVREAIDARDYVKKAEKSYKTKALKAKIEKVENDFAQYALGLIQTFGLNEKVEGTTGDLKELDSGLYFTIAPWVREGKFPKGVSSYKDLTFEQFEELHTAIQSVIAYGRDELASLEDEALKTVDDIVKASVEAGNNLKDKKIYDEFSKKGQFLNKIDSLLSKTKLVEFIFERLDNYSLTKNKAFGPLRKLYNRGLKAESDFKILQAKAFDAAKPHFDVLRDAQKRIEAQYKANAFEITGVPLNEDMKRVGRNRWTVERMISYLLNKGNDGNVKALSEGYRYSPEQEALIAAHFTEAELNAIQGIWNATDVLYPDLDRVHFKLYNRHLAKVLPTPVTFKANDGKEVTLRGGYYPLVFDHAINDKAEAFKEQQAQREADMLANQTGAVFRKTKPEDGFTYARTGGTLPPELSLGVWFSHIASTARYTAFAEYMRDLNRVTLRKDWRDMVRDKAGREVYREIRDWVSYLALPERPSPKSLWDKFLENQRQLATIAVLGANFTTGIKQRLALFNVAEEIGWGAIFDGFRTTDLVTSILGTERGDSWQKLVELSPYLKARQGNIDRELSDTLKRVSPFVQKINVAGKEFSWSDVKNFMFEFIVMNDRAMIAVSWRGAFNKYMAENAKNPNMTDAQKLTDAVQKADSVISTTQPSSLSIDMSSFQRGEGMIRLFTSFMTGALKYGNRVQLKYQAFKDGAITGRQYFRHLLYETVFYGYTEALISALMFGGELPELWELVTAPLETLVSWIPFVRDIAGAAKYQGKKIGDSTAFEGVNRIFRASQTTARAMGGDAEWSKVYWDIGRAVEFQLGVPALRVVKDINRNYDNLTGKGDK